MHSAWRGNFSAYNLARELPRRSGDGAAQFTDRVTAALRRALADLPDTDVPPNGATVLPPTTVSP